jgi:hypothetical protein
MARLRRASHGMMMPMEIGNSSLHYTIIRHFIDHGHPPSIEVLAEHFRKPREAVIAGLKALQEYHGVVLHPVTSEVWITHPFCGAPTNFWVQSAKGNWWGNCAWCSAGIASLINDDAIITTTLGGEAEQVTVRIQNGRLLDQGLLVHFPIPMQQAWNNVIYTCSTMLLFDSEAHIDDWCRRHRIAKGDVQPLLRVWQFANVWYSRHLDPAWEKWSADEAKAIFRQFGFIGAVWDIPTGATRF